MILTDKAKRKLAKAELAKLRDRIRQEMLCCPDDGKRSPELTDASGRYHLHSEIVQRFSTDEQDPHYKHHLSRVDTVAHEGPQPYRSTHSELVWFTSAKNIRELVHYGVFKPSALCGKFIAVMGQYRLKMIRRIYHFGVSSPDQTHKLKVLRLVQRIAKQLQPLESIQCSRDSYLINQTRIKNVISDLLAYQARAMADDKFGKLKRYSEELPQEISLFISEIISAVRRLSAGSLQDTTVIQNELKLLLTRCVDFAEYVSQVMTYARDKNPSMSRGSFRTVCEDARVVIDNHVIAPYTQITTEHQYGIPASGSDEKLYALPLSKIGNSTQEIEGALMAISQIEGCDEIMPGPQMSMKRGLANPNAAATNISIKAFILRARVNKYRAYVWHLWKFSVVGILLKRIGRGFHRKAQAVSDFDGDELRQPFLQSPNAEERSETAYRRFGFYIQAGYETSMYASLTRNIKLVPESAILKTFRNVGRFIVQYTVGAVTASFQALAIEVGLNIQGVVEDWREGYWFKPEKKGDFALATLWQDLHTEARKAQLEKDSGDAPPPINQVPIAGMVSPPSTGQLENDAVNFVTNQVKRIFDDLSEVQTKYPLAGSALTVTILLSAASIVLHNGQLTFINDLCKNLGIKSSVNHPLTNMINTAYTFGLCTHEGLAILSGAERSWLRQILLGGAENLPALLIAIGALVAVGTAVPQLSDIVTCTQMFWTSVKNYKDWMPQVVFYVIGASVAAELCHQAVYPEEKRERIADELPRALGDLPNQLRGSALMTALNQMLLKDLCERFPHLLAALPYRHKRMVLRSAKQMSPGKLAFLRHLEQILFPKPTFNFLANTIYIPLLAPVKILRLIFSLGQGDSRRQFQEYVVTNSARVFYAVINIVDATLQYLRNTLRAPYDVITNQMLGRFIGGHYTRRNANFFSTLNRAWSRARLTLQRLPNFIRRQVASQPASDAIQTLSYQEIHARMQLPPGTAVNQGGGSTSTASTQKKAVKTTRFGYFLAPSFACR